MLFYTSIFVASLIATRLATFFYKAIANKARLVNTSYTQITITGNSRNYQRKRIALSTCDGIHTQPAQVDEMVVSNLGKWSPDDYVACHHQDTSWLVREKRLLSTYESYTARRSAEPELRTLDMISKPFRRSVPS